MKTCEYGLEFGKDWFFGEDCQYCEKKESCKEAYCRLNKITYTNLTISEKGLRDYMINWRC